MMYSPHRLRNRGRIIPRKSSSEEESEISSEPNSASTMDGKKIAVTKPQPVIDYSALEKPIHKVFQPRIIPVGGASVTMKNGFFILTNGEKVQASDKAVKLRAEWEEGRKKMERECEARARKRHSMGRPLFSKKETEKEPEHYMPPVLPVETDELFELGNTVETGPNIDDFMEQTVKVDNLDTEDVPIPEPIGSVDEIDLPPQMKENLRRMGITEFLPIQRHVISIVRDGYDVIGCAPTGTGKTAAFLIPIIYALDIEQKKSSLLRPKQNPRALILVPTRELAMQMQTSAAQIAHKMGISVFALYGTIDRDVVRNNLQPDILIATPGRMLELVQKDLVKLSGIHFVVIDEADRMFLKSFPEVCHILENNSLPRKDMRQTMFFSATVPYHQIPFLKRHQYRPFSVKIGFDGPVSVVQQTFERTVGFGEKMAHLRKTLDIAAEEQKSVLVFCGAISNVERLARDLRYSSVAAIHGEMRQEERTANLERFTKGECLVLLATDVASRGLDIADVGLVVNYSIPRSVDDYIHRVGRSGRKGHGGSAVTFIDPTHKYDARLIVPLVTLLQECKMTLPVWLLEEAERRNPNYLPNDGDPPSDAEDLADLGIFVNAEHYTKAYDDLYL